MDLEKIDAAIERLADQVKATASDAEKTLKLSQALKNLAEARQPLKSK